MMSQQGGIEEILRAQELPWRKSPSASRFRYENRVFISKDGCGEQSGYPLGIEKIEQAAGAEPLDVTRSP